LKKTFPVSAKKFPVLKLREFAPQHIEFTGVTALQNAVTGPAFGNFPVIFPVGREGGSGDGFAQDCVHSQLENQSLKELRLLTKPGRRLSGVYAFYMDWRG
jgi:hypothetical protein